MGWSLRITRNNLECGTELSPDAKFCSSCGAQVGLKKEVFQVSLQKKLVENFKEVAKDASVKRIVVKNESGKTILSMPVTWGAVATLALAPWLAALGVIAGIATSCTIEVEKTPTSSRP